MSNTVPMVVVDQLVVRFPVRGKGKQSYITPVDHVSFSIQPGEVLALVGESGSGKTTIGRALVRIIEPNQGTITVKGQNITHIKGHLLHDYRKVTQMIFQDPFGSLNPIRTVESHLRFPLKKHRLNRSQTLDEMIDDLLLRVGLTPVQEMRKKHPHELSGGQRQRLAIARALAVNPSFVVADEPISMLDVSIRAGILKLMNQLKQDMGLSYLYITHDLASARYFGDRIMVLYGGKVMEVAKSKELIRKPLNPYTQLLLSATPGNPLGMKLPETSNEAPNLGSDRMGCPFYNRCPKATNLCNEVQPELVEVEPAHYAACHHL